MEPTQELIDDIYRQRVLQARQTPPDAKLVAGLQLFDYACGITKAGIRDQFPHADEERVLEILRERVRWQQARDEQGLYRPATEEAE